jgi:hypothetical protein
MKSVFQVGKLRIGLSASRMFRIMPMLTREPGAIFFSWLGIRGWLGW